MDLLHALGLAWLVSGVVILRESYNRCDR
ncbi:hypothetical protein OOU_Y34scaffold00416g2 [Pyricularia oryzae Y34]|uniref:Uncharacterized protein n=1 Tax=Pyricularia oryzae (strain Y34) TaxID=1143189 RepID=A0AA97PMZ8_PYRO3|nr:hypothetical protein OOU_Y34scaffold00416g2 [Pyricularia oryzae Y34]